MDLSYRILCLKSWSLCGSGTSSKFTMVTAHCHQLLLGSPEHAFGTVVLQ